MLSNLEIAKIGFAVFCALTGATYQFTKDKKEENYTVGQRLVSLFTAVLLMALVESIALFVFTVNWLFVSFLGLILSIGAEKFLRLLGQYYDEAKDPIDLIQRIIRAWKIVKTESENQKTNGADAS